MKMTECGSYVPTERNLRFDESSYMYVDWCDPIGSVAWHIAAAIVLLSHAVVLYKHARQHNPGAV